MKPRGIQWVITVGAVALAIGHVLLPTITIDAVTVTLLGIAVLPWLRPLFKSVEIPGGVKVEFQDLEEARKKVEESGLIPQRQLKPMQEHKYAFQAVTEHDPNLALSGLRIEIESRLKDLAEQRNLTVHSRQGAGGLTRLLENAGVLSNDEAAAIRDLLPLLNQAAHGAEVDPAAFGWAMDFGPQILGALEDRLGETTIPSLLERWKRRDGGAVMDIGTELSKALAQAPGAFLSTMSANPDEFRTWLDGLPQHTFTIYSGSELENELSSAYLNKLKELMIQAAASCRESEHAQLVEAVESALRRTEVRCVW